MEWTRRFEKLNKDDTHLAGGKGASLGEMTRAKIPVPDGFVILADSFNLFLEANGLHAGIAAELVKVNIHDTNSVEHASETIRAMIASAPIPDELIQAVEKG